VGWGALWLVTVQLLAGLAVLVLIVPRYEFPRNLEVWLAWSRIAFVTTAIVIVLSIIGQTRARVQILLCALTISSACVMIASLA